MKLSKRNILKLLQLQDDWKQFIFILKSEIDGITAVSDGPSEALIKIIWVNVKNHTLSIVGSFLRLARRFSEKRLESACQRVLFYGFDSIDMIKTVLTESLDMLPLDSNTDIYGQPELF
jgi:hypothetical protein